MFKHKKQFIFLLIHSCSCNWIIRNAPWFNLSDIYSVLFSHHIRSMKFMLYRKILFLLSGIIYKMFQTVQDTFCPIMSTCIIYEPLKLRKMVNAIQKSIFWIAEFNNIWIFVLEYLFTLWACIPQDSSCNQQEPRFLQ